MDIKCIALDLDGTTLNQNKQISERTRTAIQQAISKGIQVVIASGRCFDSLPPSIREIDGIEYAITSNGAAMYQLPEGKCIRKYSIPEKSVDKIMDMTRSIHCGYEVFYEGKAYAEESYIKDPCSYGVSAGSVEYIRTTRNAVADISLFIAEHKYELDSIDLIIPNENNYVEVFECLKQMKDEIYVTISSKSRIEIASHQAGKHTGLQYILDCSGIRCEETAAFGDADNDIEMMKFVKYGMAVQNASTGCKEAAREIVPGNTEDGVAVGIEKIMSWS